MLSTFAAALIAFSLSGPVTGPICTPCECPETNLDLKDPFAPSPADAPESSRPKSTPPRDLINPFQDDGLSQLPAPSTQWRVELPGVDG
jgi:hypothetical protein